MALANQEPNSGNSLIKDLISDEESYREPEAPIQDPEGEQIIEGQEEPLKPMPKAKAEPAKPEAKDQAPKKQEYRLKGKSDKKQPAEEAPSVEEEESAEPSEGVMTAEFVREHGLPKNMVGLPYSELGRSYRNITSEYTRTRQRMAEMERGHAVPEEKAQVKPEPTKETVEDKPIGVMVQEHLSKLPDPLDEGFQAGLTKAITDIAVNIQSSVRKEYAKALADETGKLRPQIESAQEYAKRQAQKELSDEIQRSLPEGVNIQEVLKAFKEEYADDLADLMPLYEKKPQRFVKDLVNFFNLNFELQDVAGPTEGELDAEELEEMRLNALAQKKAAEALKESKKKKPSDFNSRDKRPNPKRTELMSDLLSDEEATFNQMNPQE